MGLDGFLFLYLCHRVKWFKLWLKSLSTMLMHDLQGWCRHLEHYREQLQIMTVVAAATITTANTSIWCNEVTGYMEKHPHTCNTSSLPYCSPTLEWLCLIYWTLTNPNPFTCNDDLPCCLSVFIKFYPHPCTLHLNLFAPSSIKPKRLNSKLILPPPPHTHTHTLSHTNPHY